MREIKFRAWSKRTNNMLRSVSLKHLTLSQHIDDVLGFDDLEIMQFTGLHDKNGKEIYEGDILSDYNETDEGLKKSHSQVFWNEFTASYHLDNSFNQDKSCSSELWKELNDFEYEVSGNIHHDKELLTKIQNNA